MESGETLSQWRKHYFQKFGVRIIYIFAGLLLSIELNMSFIDLYVHLRMPELSVGSHVNSKVWIHKGEKSIWFPKGFLLSGPFCSLSLVSCLI